MSRSRDLRMIYREVPAVEGCKAGCGRCCGPVPWSREELARVEDRIPEGMVRMPAPDGAPAVLLVHPLTPLRCPFLQADKSCAVYEDRPLMCRIYGASSAPAMVCPFGARAKRPLPEGKAEALIGRYQEVSP